MLLQIPKYQEKRSISLIHSFLIFDLVDNLRKRKTQLFRITGVRWAIKKGRVLVVHSGIGEQQLDTCDAFRLKHGFTAVNNWVFWSVDQDCSISFDIDLILLHCYFLTLLLPFPKTRGRLEFSNETNVEINPQLIFPRLMLSAQRQATGISFVLKGYWQGCRIRWYKKTLLKRIERIRT